MLLAVGLIALAARCGFVLFTRHSFSLINDAADYSRLAMLLSSGHGFGTSHFAPGGGPTAMRPPAFPLMLASVYAVAGAHVLAARLADAALGATSALLVVVLARQLGASRRRMWSAGLLAALLPPMVIASTSVMSEGLFVPLSLSVMICALSYRRGGNLWWLGLCGFLLGLATLTRPIAAVLVLSAGLIAFRGKRRPRALTAGVLAGALALLPCLAWEVRDVLVMHHVIPLTTQDGYFLAGTYNSTSAHFPGQPGVWIVPTQDPAMARLVLTHPHAGEVRLNDLFDQAAVDYASRHPAYVLTVVGRNLLRLFDLTAPSFTQAAVFGEYGYSSGVGTADYVSTLAVLVLALVGLLRGGARGRAAGVWLAPLIILIVTLPTRANPRFRAPLDPYLVLLASAPLAEMAGRVSLRARRSQPRLLG